MEPPGEEGEEGGHREHEAEEEAAAAEEMEVKLVHGVVIRGDIVLVSVFLELGKLVVKFHPFCLTALPRKLL